MRAPFAYENNASLIRHALVPDPLSESQWNKLLSAWRAADQESSLLEWILAHADLAEIELMTLMCHAVGVEALTEGLLQPVAESADRKLLEANGFLILGKRGDKGIVTGGPDFPPDLSAFLGNRAGQWKWVLVSPLHGRSKHSFPVSLKALDTEVSPTELESWIRGLLEETRLSGASDIHFERNGGTLLVRTRTNGEMRELATAGAPRSVECIRHLKRLANFSTADNPFPQDGRICIGGGEQHAVYRASHIRTTRGESLVLRTISRPAAIPRLDELGVPGKLQQLLRDAVTRNTGLVLCTGATCSGKSTTLFSLLDGIRRLPLKVISIEDPVEVEIPSLTQSSVDSENGWSFAVALRAYLRQDPDVLFVGEIRDKESAEGAARAALTGHAVLSTLHASSPLVALERLRGWGLPPGLIAETVRLVTHQRLVPRGSGPEQTAEFNWIYPDPESLYTCLSGGPTPAGWETATKQP